MANAQVSIDVVARNQTGRGLSAAEREVKQRTSRMANSVKQFGNAFKNIVGAFGIGFGLNAVVGGIQNVVRQIDDLKDAADAIGFDPQRFQILSAAAQNAGIPLSRLTNALAALNDMTDEIGGDNTATKTLNRLGVDLDQFVKSSPADQFKLLADAIKQTGDSSAVLDLFGKRAAKLKLILSELADNGYEGMGKTVSGIVDGEILETMSEAEATVNNIKRTMTAEVANSIVFWKNLFTSKPQSQSAAAYADQKKQGLVSRPSEVIEQQKDVAAAEEKFRERAAEATRIRKDIQSLEVQNKDLQTRQMQSQLELVDEKRDLEPERDSSLNAVRRIHGKGAQSWQDMVDEETKRLLDHDFEKEMKRRDKGIARDQARLEKQTAAAQRKRRAGLKLTKREKRLLARAKDEQNLNLAQQHVEAQKDEAEHNQREQIRIMLKIAENTDALKQLGMQ